MAAHPDLISAIVLASLAATPEHAKQKLVSKDSGKRASAKEALVATIIIALNQAR